MVAWTQIAVMPLSPFPLSLYFLSRRSKHFIASLCPFIPLLPHTLLFLCKFSFLTFSQVKAVGHPGVNCTACNGWWEKKKAKSNFPAFLCRVRRRLCPTLWRPQVKKRNRHLSASHSVRRRLEEKRAVREEERGDVIAARTWLEVGATRMAVITARL